MRARARPPCRRVHPGIENFTVERPVNPALHPEPGGGESELETQLPHLVPFRFRQVGGGLKAWIGGADCAEGLERSGVDSREEGQMPLKELRRIVRAKIIRDGRGEVPLVRPAVLGPVEEPVALLEDLQIVGEEAVVLQKPSDERRKILKSSGGIAGEGVRREVLTRWSASPRC